MIRMYGNGTQNGKYHSNDVIQGISFPITSAGMVRIATHSDSIFCTRLKKKYSPMHTLQNHSDQCALWIISVSLLHYICHIDTSLPCIRNVSFTLMGHVSHYLCRYAQYKGKHVTLYDVPMKAGFISGRVKSPGRYNLLKIVPVRPPCHKLIKKNNHQ